MEIKFIDKSSCDKPICRINVNGAIYFNISASKLLNIISGDMLKIGINKNDVKDKNIYVIVDYENKNEGFKVIKSSSSYYIYVKKILDNMGIDYVNNIITYAVIPFKNDGIDMFKLEFNSEKKQLL